MLQLAKVVNDMERIPENTERLVTVEELVEYGLEVSHDLAVRLLGGRATEMYALPIDPMDIVEP